MPATGTLTLPPASDVLDAVRRDWRAPKKLQAAFGDWVKHQHAAVEVLAATIGGSTQVRSVGRRRRRWAGPIRRALSVHAVPPPPPGGGRLPPPPGAS